LATWPAVLPGCLPRNSTMLVLVSTWRVRAVARRVLARRAVARRPERAGAAGAAPSWCAWNSLICPSSQARRSWSSARLASSVSKGRTAGSRAGHEQWCAKRRDRRIRILGCRIGLAAIVCLLVSLVESAEAPVSGAGVTAVLVGGASTTIAAKYTGPTDEDQRSRRDWQAAESARRWRGRRESRPHPQGPPHESVAARGNQQSGVSAAARSETEAASESA
jgi:hypothetical protein